MQVKKLHKVPLIALLVIVLISLYAVILKNKSLTITVEPLMYVALFSYYLIKSPVRDLKIILHYIFYTIGVSTFVYTEQDFYMTYGLSLMAISRVFIVFYAIDVSKIKDNKKYLLPILSFTIPLVCISGVVAYNHKVNFPVMIFYILTVSILGGITFVDFMKKSSKSNTNMFLGVIFLILTESIFSAVLARFEVYYIDFFFLIANVTSNYFFCQAFVLKDEKSSILYRT